MVQAMIYVIRHGQTELNNRHVLQGRSDHPLNETGRQGVKIVCVQQKAPET